MRLQDPRPCAMIAAHVCMILYLVVDSFIYHKMLIDLRTTSTDTQGDAPAEPRGSSRRGVATSSDARPQPQGREGIRICSPARRSTDDIRLSSSSRSTTSRMSSPGVVTREAISHNVSPVATVYD